MTATHALPAAPPLKRPRRVSVATAFVGMGSAMVFAALLGLYLTEVQLPQRIAAAMLSITSEKWAILAILNVFFLIIGMFLHSAAAIVLVRAAAMEYAEHGIRINAVAPGRVVTPMMLGSKIMDMQAVAAG